MNHNFTSFYRRELSLRLMCAILCTLLLTSVRVNAQQSKITSINSLTSTPWINTTGGFSVNQSNSDPGLAFWESGGLSGNDTPDKVINSNLNDFATAHVVVAGSATLKVVDNPASFTYNAGNFAGFVISTSGAINIGLLGNITIRTYLNGGTAQEEKTGANLLSISSSISGAYEVGFYTTRPYNQIEITFAGVLQNFNVYYAVMRAYQATTTPLTCNVPTRLNQPTFPAVVDPNNTGFGGLLNIGSISDQDDAVSADLTDAASLALTGSVAGSGSFAIKLQNQVFDATTNSLVDGYPAGTFAGLDISNASLIGADVNSGIRLQTYYKGSPTNDIAATGSLLVAGNTALLTGVGRRTIGFVTTQPFDEIKLTVGRGLLSVDVGTTLIYGAVVKRLCGTTLACNTTYPLNNPTFPTIIDDTRTGPSGLVAVGASVTNPDNVITASTTDFARITNTLSGVARSSVAVHDPINTYPAGTYAGFTIRKVTGILSTDLFPQLTITTYRDGNLVQSKTGSTDLLDLSINLFGTSTGFFNVGFVTDQPFDEIQLSVAPLVNIAALTPLGGSLDVFGAFIDTQTSLGGGLFCALKTNPDFAVTNKSVPATGSVRLNDNVPAGTTYGPAPTPTTQPASASPSLTVNSNGTYTFTSATPGVYVYAVPVCGAGMSGTACTSQTLTITVLDPTVNTNKPVANPDVVSTIGAATNPSLVTVNVKANDGPGNAGGTLGVPTIAIAPANGSATVDGSGNVVYTPNANFFGTDVLTYQVCETPGSNLCATATVTITVKAPGSANTTVAADDYVSTYQSLSATGNVKTNDSDPEGNTQTVTAQTTTIPGKGTLVVTSAGSYTFTPVAGATGPVDFSYVTTDNGSPAVSATGTLHILINPFNPNPDFVVTNKSVPATGSVRTNDVIPVGATYGPAPSPASSPSGSTPTLTVNTDGTFTFSSATPGVYVYNVPVCALAPPTYCTTQTLTITVLDPAVTTNPPVANPDFATITGSPTTPVATVVNVKVNDGPGNPGGTLGTPTIATGPAHGTASIDGNGNLVYTPTAGYYGTDIVTYQVCETPTNCATATVSITVKAPGAPANVSINDDYVSTTGGTPATGNVLTNDQGNTLTVSNAGTTSTSSGTLVLTATGSYTFTPAPGVTGPVNLTYTACDNSTPSVCGSATLHVLVGQAMPDLTPIIRLPQANFLATGVESIRNLAVEITESTGQPTSSGNVTITITVPNGYTVTYDNTITSIAVSGGSTVPVDNSKWTVTNNLVNLQLTLKINAGQFIAGKGKAVLGFTVTRNVVTSGSVSNITVGVTDDATMTYDSVPANNIFARIVNAL